MSPYLNGSVVINFALIYFGGLSLLTIDVVALFLGLEEWHQSFLPGRAPNFYDFLLATGACCCDYASLNMINRT